MQQLSDIYDSKKRSLANSPADPFPVFLGGRRPAALAIQGCHLNLQPGRPMGGGLGISPNLQPHTQGGPQTGLIRACLLRKETGQCHKSSHEMCSHLMLLYQRFERLVTGRGGFSKTEMEKYLCRAHGLYINEELHPSLLLNFDLNDFGSFHVTLLAWHAMCMISGYPAKRIFCIIAI